jgi:hypothetical protein
MRRARQRVRSFSVDSAVSLTLRLYNSVLAEAGCGSRGRTEQFAFQKDGGPPDSV